MLLIQLLVCQAKGRSILEILDGQSRQLATYKIIKCLKIAAINKATNSFNKIAS